MKADELEAILAVCLEAAREAGDLVRAGFRNKKLAVEHKGPVDLVTQYDRDSEAMIRARLGASFPHGVIGEESGGLEGDAVFYVDPIDGTTNFVHGHPFWCVSIGLVANGQPVLGVVHAPVLGLEWFGWIADDGSTRAARRSWGCQNAGDAEEEELCAVSANADFQDALLATGFPYDRRTSTDNNFDAFVTIKRRVQAVRRCGSAALDLCLVADGTYEGYWERKLRPWDIAAGIAIVRAAGGTVTDFEGGETSIQSGHVIATNGAIHRELLEELARVRASMPPAT